MWKHKNHPIEAFTIKFSMRYSEVPEALKQQAHTCQDERQPVIPADWSLMMAQPGGTG